MNHNWHHPAKYSLVLGLALVLLMAVACQVVWPFEKSNQLTKTATATPTLTPQPRGSRNWPGPVETPVTPVPTPMMDFRSSDEVESIVLLGLDQDYPYSGRTDAMYIILYNRRTSMASVISIPPDLFVYIPGYTMQRINNAYPVGGIPLVMDTLEYNLGIVPDHYVIVQFGDFPRIIDAIGGIDIVVVDDLTDPCQLQPGSIHMNGGQAFCYAIYRKGEDDIERNRRQLQVMRAFFLRLIVDGQIVYLPSLMPEFENSVQTDLTLFDIMSSIPLAIQLADPRRIGYFQISWDEVIQWIIPGRAKTIVLLPNTRGLSELISEAQEFVMISVPISDLATTLSARLTQLAPLSPTPSSTTAPSTATLTPTMSVTPGTSTVTPSVTITLTPTLTVGAYP